MTQLPFHGQSVKLVWKYGEEAICPICGNHNACLQTMSRGEVTIYECRDCHTMYLAHHEDKVRDLGKDETLGRKIGEQDAKVIGRSLGKNCYKCHSFDLEQMDYEARQDWQTVEMELKKIDKWEAARLCPTHRCSNCGEYHRY